jgi:8-oxo-dGTP pyrophosphatase MutT (NUDIX family)
VLLRTGDGNIERLARHVKNKEVRFMERWRVLEQKVEPLMERFALRRARAMLPHTGVTHEFILLDSPDWVNIIPVTDDDHVVMIRQHRLGSNELELEIPGGLIDAGDRDALAAAQRELLEETGYQAKNWTPIGVISPNPALQSNRCHTFLAEGSQRCGDPTPDLTESLQVVLVPRRELLPMIASGDINHGLALNAFFLYSLHQGLVRI